jgi:selenocysteine lyase/cysteine desulfurase
MVFDIDRLRAETPGADRVLHLNHAGASLAPQSVLDTVTEHLLLEAEIGAMEAGIATADRLAAVYRDAATLIGAAPDEIAVAGGNADGWNRAFAALSFKAGDRILVARSEWGGNLSNLERAAARTGARIEVIPSREDGTVDVERLAGMLDARVRLVSLTWCPANGGLIQPAAEVGRLTRAADIPYFIDAAQALGQIPVDVAALNCDILTAPGRKHLRGPRGTGLLYIRRGFLERLDPAFVDTYGATWQPEGPALRADARLFEPGEASPALRLGLGTAIRLALDLGVARIRERIDTMAGELRRRLAVIPEVTLQDLGVERSGLVSFTMAGMAPAELQGRMKLAGINMAANGVPYTPLDMRARGLDAIARAAVSYLTTEAELDRFDRALRAILS